MSRQRTAGTGPEMTLRRLLHARGLRYRVDRRPVAGVNRRADVIFGPAKVAVFVDGCFWHGCPMHYTVPATNATFWTGKIMGNRTRDDETDRLLTEAGWYVFRLWEHDDPGPAAEDIAQVVRQRRPPGASVNS